MEFPEIPIPREERPFRLPDEGNHLEYRANQSVSEDLDGLLALRLALRPQHPVWVRTAKPLFARCDELFAAVYPLTKGA
jgi:hypothetical protein